MALAATKVVSLPPAVIEPAIAVTIILAALDNVWPIFLVKRVVVAFLFGLVHGFGFAGVLAETTARIGASTNKGEKGMMVMTPRTTTFGLKV